MSTPYPPWVKPDIGPRLKPPMKNLFESWSGLTGEDLIKHLHHIQAQAQQHGAWPCIGSWFFLLPSISAFPEFPALLDRARSKTTKILDLGCALGQDLRLLAANGVPTKNMYASDIDPELWNLGLELFRDKDKMHAQFVEADIFDTTASSGLHALQGKMDIIIACQFLHLFNWDGQVKAMKRIVDLSRPGTVLIGHQQGQVEAREIEIKWARMYCHDVESFRKIWRQVEKETGSQWEVRVELVEMSRMGAEEGDCAWAPGSPRSVNFVVTRRG